MRRLLRFLGLLLAGLGVLTGVGYFALVRTTRDWFADDIALRSRLAVASARESLARHWTTDRVQLTQTLADIARDERIMAAAACSPRGDLLAATESYPPEFSCHSVIDRMRGESKPGSPSWSMTAELPAGRVNLSATSVPGESGPLGAVLLVHDLSYLGRREATTRLLLLVAFFVLSLGGAGVTLVAARLAWRDWTLALRRALKGDAGTQFQPLMRDVRALAETL
ncbi:MAG TPA: hypothetical protein VHU40_01075, partial [Polyangia bacterium]|nr:hypothetical protein [Polyangia bacterium]